MTTLVPLSDAAYAVVRVVRADLDALVRALGSQDDTGRRRTIRAYIARARTLLCRFLALVRWARSHGDFSRRCTADAEGLDAQHMALRRVADELYFTLHGGPGREGVWRACVPQHDVRTALDVIGGGTYSQLPDVVGEMAAAPASDADEETALSWLRAGFRLRRAAWRLPEGMEVADGRGCVLCTVAGEYEAALWTYPPAEGKWQVLRLRLLVGSDGGGGGVGGRRWARAVERVHEVVATDTPEEEVGVMERAHEALHGACCALALDALHAQAAALCRGHWAGKLSALLEPADADRPPCLRLSYAWDVGAASLPSVEHASSSAAAAAWAVLVLRPADEWGLAVEHEPPISADVAGPADAARVSTAELRVESILLDAIRARSIETLRRCAAALPASAAASLDEATLLPLLRAAGGSVALAVLPHSGKLALMGSPAITSGKAKGGGHDGTRALQPLLSLAPLIDAIERGAVALGVDASAPPPLSAAHEGGGGVDPAGWLPMEAGAVRRGEADARWLPLPSVDGWFLEVRLVVTEAGVRCEYTALRLATPEADVADAAEGAPSSVRYAARLSPDLDCAPSAPSGGAAGGGAADAVSSLPLALTRAVVTARLETLRCGLREEGLDFEELPGGATLKLEPPARARCQPLAPACHEPADSPTAPIILRVTAEGGWVAMAPLLKAPGGGRALGTPLGAGTRSSSGALVRFDARGAAFAYSDATSGSIRSLLVDLQGVAACHALHRHLLRLDASTSTLRLLEASGCRLRLLGKSGRRLSIEWGEPGAAASGASPSPGSARVELRIAVDGAPVGASQREDAAAFARSCDLGALVRLFELDGEGANAGPAAASARRKRGRA